MSQCCVKICTPQDIAQSNDSRRPQPTTDIGGRQYEAAKNEMEMRRIGIENMKADLKANKPDSPIALPQGQIPLAITTNTNPIEVNTLQMAKSSEEIVGKNNIDAKSTSNPKISTQAQGEVGEYQARCLVVEQLGISLIDYNQGKHGIDDIGVDKDGHFCILEYKFTASKNGISSLETYKMEEQNGNPILCEDNQPWTIKQGGLDWVTDRLNSMQQDKHELYSERNAQVAKQIQEAIEKGQIVNRYVVHIHPTTLNMTVNKDHGDGDWQFESAFRCINE